MVPKTRFGAPSGSVQVSSAPNVTAEANKPKGGLKVCAEQRVALERGAAGIFLERTSETAACKKEEHLRTSTRDVRFSSLNFDLLVLGTLSASNKDEKSAWPWGYRGRVPVLALWDHVH